MHNDEFFVRIMCNTNQTSRYIICCSQHNYCNDLDAYSKEIRTALLSTLEPGTYRGKDYSFMIEYYHLISILATRPSQFSFSTVILIIIISIFVIIILLLGFIIIYIRNKSSRANKDNYEKAIAYGEGNTKTTRVDRLLKCLRYKKRPTKGQSGLIPSDQSITALLDEWSTSTSGPGTFI